mgnify:CR=1 FL=1
MKEITFEIEEDLIDGGYVAHALEYGITTQADNEKELKAMIVDAVKCHFEDDEIPKIINLRFVRNEVLSV